MKEVDSAEKKFHNYIATLLRNYIVTEIFFLFLMTNKPLSLPCLHTLGCKLIDCYCQTGFGQSRIEVV